MKTNNLILRQVNTGTIRPIFIAQAFYQQFSTIPFFDELDNYLMYHMVVSTPAHFALFRLTNLAKDGEPEDLAWFVRFAYGDLQGLLRFLPAYLDKICWCRNRLGKPYDGKLRIYKLSRLLALASRKEKT